MAKVKIPGELKRKLTELAKQHQFASLDAFVDHLIERGLVASGADAAKPLAQQIADVVEVQGYSSRDELIEHLLERGIQAYDTTETDREKLLTRLRGLGYIE
jgi:hypothetical protein